MKKYSTYAFWVALASSLVVFLDDIANIFGININTTSVENLILSFCGILVALGIINKSENSSNSDDDDIMISDNTINEEENDASKMNDFDNTNNDK